MLCHYKELLKLGCLEGRWCSNSSPEQEPVNNESIHQDRQSKAQFCKISGLWGCNAAAKMIIWQLARQLSGATKTYTQTGNFDRYKSESFRRIRVSVHMIRHMHVPSDQLKMPLCAYQVINIFSMCMYYEKNVQMIRIFGGYQLQKRQSTISTYHPWNWTWAGKWNSKQLTEESPIFQRQFIAVLKNKTLK